MTELQSIPLSRIDGTAVSLRDFAGSVLLVVNVASKCGLTPQYEALEKLYREYRDAGLSVLGFPANDFGAQEPGTNQEIAEFCSTRFDVDFPMFEKLSVKGAEQHPLYKALVAAQPSATQAPGSGFAEKLRGYGIVPDSPSDVLWNFEKFLIDREGNVIDRFAPDVTPDSPELRSAIDRALAR